MSTIQYTRNNFTINIDLTRDSILNDAGVSIMKDRYLLKEYDNENHTWINLETSPQECFARAACEFGSNQDHAQRLYDYASLNWMMFATPILTNAGTSRGLPISCFLNYVDDSMVGILDHHHETGFLSSYGGGVGGDWSSVRSINTRTSRGNVSTGVIPFVRMMDAEMLAVQQGSSRRGAYAAYIDISHPEIEEFIDIRTAQGKDLNRRCLGTGFHHAVNITDNFMVAVKEGKNWDLIDPATKEVAKSVSARELWMSLLIKRLETGEPYIHFIDASNRALPEPLKQKGLRVNNSNLCSEITLPTSVDRTAVCCLSSVNLEYFDEWSTNPLFIKDMMEMLDNVLDYFIEKCPPQMWRARNSAMNSRDVGLGAMGFHFYLQKKGISFETPMAIGATRKMAQHIQAKALEASKELAALRGEAPDMKGTGLRFAHMIAIAPNANIAPICGNTSPSIEPYSANAFKSNTLSGTFLMKNKILEKLLKQEYNLRADKEEEVWQSIILNKGSVQHLKFLKPEHLELFKTARELDQAWIVEHASQRQPFICQAQSVNLFLPANVHKNDLHKLHFSAWEKGLKSLYYCRSRSIRQTETGGSPDETVNINIPSDEKTIADKYTEKNDNNNNVDFDTQETSSCLSCEG